MPKIYSEYLLPQMQLGIFNCFSHKMNELNILFKLNLFKFYLPSGNNDLCFSLFSDILFIEQ